MGEIEKINDRGTFEGSREYLTSLKVQNDRINALIEELENLETLVTKITPSVDKVNVQSSGSQDRLGDSIARIVDIRRELNLEIDVYADHKNEVIEHIKKMENADNKELLFERYVNMRSDKDTMMFTNLWDKTYRKHRNNAIREFSRTWINN